MRTALVFLLGLGLLPGLLWAQREKWTTLFNGKNLDGWVLRNGQADFRVVNGAIVGTAVANSPNSFLCTTEDYGDFILELELWSDGLMNSGIQFRSLATPAYQNGRVHGYQAEVDPSPRAWSGGIYDEGRREWLYIPNLNPAAKKAFRPNAWNHYRIEAIGPVLRTWINGIPVAHLIDDLTPRGFIALQVHAVNATVQPGAQIRWRNIRIQTTALQPRPWDDAPVVNLLPNHLSPQELAQGFSLLFNGQDLAGWRAVHGNSLPTRRWSVQNGEIAVAASDGSETGNDIVTRDSFGVFEFCFEFQLSPGANSGIKYFVNEAFESGGKSGIGLEYQLLDDALHPDAKAGVVGNRTLSSLYDLIPATSLEPRFQRPIGAWNQGRILVFPNNQVEYWLNGFKVLQYERKSNIFKALVARSKYAKYPNFGENATGPILLQDHGDAVRFRSLKIRTRLNNRPSCD